MTVRCQTLPARNPGHSINVAIGLVICVFGSMLPQLAAAQLLQRSVAFQGARIITMDGAVIDNGTLLLKGEKIIAVGPQVDLPALAKKIDAQGMTITPGLVDAFSALGRATASGSGPANPMRRAEDAFDRYDTASFEEALRHGVTAVYLSPSGPAGICGTGAVLRLTGSPGNGPMGGVLRSEAALCVDLDSDGRPLARLKTLGAVRKQFRDALAYRRSLETYEKDLAEYTKKLKVQTEKNKKKSPPKGKPTLPGAGEDEKKKEPPEKKPVAKPGDPAKPQKPRRPTHKPTLEVVLRALDRKMPVRVLAHQSSDILNALDLAEAFSVDLILEGATEAYLVADRIAAAKVPVILGRMDRNGLPSNDVYRRAIRRHGAALDDAGVSWIVGSGADDPHRARFVAWNAQLATAHADRRDPLQLVTAESAEALGVARHIGRLRPGNLADLVLWSEDPLDPTAQVRKVYVGGRLVYQSDN